MNSRKENETFYQSNTVELSDEALANVVGGCGGSSGGEHPWRQNHGWNHQNRWRNHGWNRHNYQHGHGRGNNYGCGYGQRWFGGNLSGDGDGDSDDDGDTL